MTNPLTRDFLDSAKTDFIRYKRLGADAIDVLDEDELNSDPHGANSIAIIVKHLHGNMRSRWTGLLTEGWESLSIPKGKSSGPPSRGERR